MLAQLEQLKSDLERHILSLELPKGTLDRAKEHLETIGSYFEPAVTDSVDATETRKRRDGCRGVVVSTLDLYNMLVKECLGGTSPCLPTFQLTNELAYFRKLKEQMAPGRAATILSAFLAHLDNFAAALRPIIEDPVNAEETWPELSLSFEIGEVRAAVSGLSRAQGFEEFESHLSNVTKYCQRYAILRHMMAIARRLVDVAMKVIIQSNLGGFTERNRTRR